MFFRNFLYFYPTFNFLNCYMGQSTSLPPITVSQSTSNSLNPDSVFTVDYPVRNVTFPPPSEKNVLLCLLIERSHGDRSVYYDYDRVVSAIEMGLDYVNNGILTNGYKITTIYKDIGRNCTKKNLTVKYALELMTQKVNCVTYLGVGCGYNADSLYNFGEYMQIPILACPAARLGNTGPREGYFMATRTSFNHRDISRVILMFFDLNQFQHVTVIHDGYVSFYEQLSIRFQTTLADRTDLNGLVNLVPINSPDVNNEGYDRLLKDGNKTCRVFVLLCNAAVTRLIMIRAQGLSMTGNQYVYLAVEPFDSDSWGKFTWSNGDSGDREAKQAFESLLIVALREIRNDYYDSFSATLKAIARNKHNYTFQAFEEIDPVTISYYNSIILYASVLNRIQAAGGNIFDGMTITKMLKGITVSSPLTSQIRISSIGDCQWDMSIKSMNPDTGRFEVSFAYTATNDSLDRNGPFYYPGGSFPKDVPRCGFQDDSIICHPPGISTGILAAAVVVPILAVLVLGGAAIFFVIRYLRNEALDPNWWKVSQQDLEVTGPKGGSASSRVGSSKRSFGDTDGETTSIQKTDATSTMSGMVGRTATLKGNVVSVLDVSEKKIRATPFLIKELNEVRVLSHQNLQRVLGVALDDDNYCIYVIGELCQKGSLMDLLETDSLKLDWSFKNSIIKDIVMGMTFLHSSSVDSHGNLTAHSCLVDSRFMSKISDYGLTTFREVRDLLPPIEEQDDRNFDLLLWRAPELMRQSMPPKGSQVTIESIPLPDLQRDVFSFAIILQQIILRSAPFDSPGDATKAHKSAKEHVLEVKKGTQPPERPVVPSSACSSELFSLMERCWNEYPIERPTFAKIRDGLKKVIGNSGNNIIDHLLKRMEQYANDLEDQLAEKTQQFMEEKHRSEELLGQLLPRSVAEALTRGQNVDPELFDSVTIYFSDIVGFTTISAAGTPMDVVSMLNNLYTLFDGILEKFDAYKVETIGDAYMVGSGLPVRNGNRHASEIALVSLQIRKELDSFVIPHQPNDKLRLRIGVHSGSCVAGIVGIKMPRYCLFGDTVQIAMKMESAGQPMKIQVSYAAKELLDDIGGFQLHESENPVIFKDKEIRTYWLLVGK